MIENQTLALILAIFHRRSCGFFLYWKSAFLGEIQYFQKYFLLLFFFQIQFSVKKMTANICLEAWCHNWDELHLAEAEFLTWVISSFNQWLVLFTLIVVMALLLHFVKKICRKDFPAISVMLHWRVFLRKCSQPVAPWMQALTRFLKLLQYFLSF